MLFEKIKVSRKIAMLSRGIQPASIIVKRNPCAVPNPQGTNQHSSGNSNVSETVFPVTEMSFSIRSKVVGKRLVNKTKFDKSPWKLSVKPSAELLNVPKVVAKKAISTFHPIPEIFLSYCATTIKMPHHRKHHQK